MKLARISAAKDLPCYAIYGGDKFSKEWANKLVDVWIETKKSFVAKPVPVEQFYLQLKRAVLEAADFYGSFEEACREAGIKPGKGLYREYEAFHLNDALNLIPSNLHAEFCWVPEWTDQGLDELLEDFGLRSDRWKSSCIEDVQPGKWLEVFLRLVNCSSTDLVGEAIRERGDEGRKLAEKCAKANFKVCKDPERPSLMTASEVIAAIENAYGLAVPMFHCEINLRTLFEMDPSKAMRLSSAKGKVHLGFHEFVNGAGYMDTYRGEVVIPANASGFAGENRWSYGIDKVYGIVKSCFYSTPAAVEV